MLNKAELNDKFIQLTISFLKTRHLEYFQTYKDFLNFNPLIEERRKILIGAIEVLFETDLVTIEWLLENSELLRPEIDIEPTIYSLIHKRYTSAGLTSGERADGGETGRSSRADR